MRKSVTPFLFHQAKFIFRHRDNPIVKFEENSALIFFSQAGDSLVSLDRAPFGGFIVDERSTEKDFVAVIAKVITWSNENSITNLLIRSFPEEYNPSQHHLIKSALLKSDFTIRHTDVTQIVPVTNQAMHLDTHKKRRVRKASDLAFTFSQLPLSLLEESYGLIVESRQSKGYPVTMSLDSLSKMFVEFPEEYKLFGVFDAKKLIAAAVCIEVNSDILYCFYLGDTLSHRSYSPVTFLVQGIYGFCQSREFKMIDLGISTDKGILNKGLYDFKKSFGTIDSVKLTFFKQL